MMSIPQFSPDSKTLFYYHGDKAISQRPDGR